MDNFIKSITTTITKDGKDTLDIIQFSDSASEIHLCDTGKNLIAFVMRENQNPYIEISKYDTFDRKLSLTLSEHYTIEINQDDKTIVVLDSGLNLILAAALDETNPVFSVQPNIVVSYPSDMVESGCIDVNIKLDGAPKLLCKFGEHHVCLVDHKTEILFHIYHNDKIVKCIQLLGDVKITLETRQFTVKSKYIDYYYTIKS
jgi:hypothetical protein